MRHFKKKKTYKVVVFEYIFMLTALLILVFGLYTFYNYQKQYYEKTSVKIENTANHITTQVDERFENLKQYYVTRVDNDSIKWFLENDIQYSEYSGYKAAYDDMSSEGIFNDYWNGFALINYETGWIISNKGMFTVDEALNKEALSEIYNNQSGVIGKNYWYYDGETDSNTDTKDKGYRVTVDTKGLNFVMRLPANSYNTYAMLIANINMDTWKGWIKELLEDGEEIVVTNKSGKLIYASDTMISESDFGIGNKVKTDTGTYMVASNVSNILGWNYYVCYNIENDKDALGLTLLIFFALFIWMAIGAFVIGYLIYSPVGNLVKNVYEKSDSGSIDGNELDYLAGSFKNLKEDKKSLELMLNRQQDKLIELFELRLIRGEVGSEELSEYLKSFGLKTSKYYKTCVIILKLGDEEIQSTVNEDAICLSLLQEMPTQLSKMAWMPPVNNAGTLFAIFSDDNEDNLVKTVSEFNEKMKLYVEELCGYSILIGASNTHENYNHIRAAYRESVNALTEFYPPKVPEHDNSYNASFEHDIQTAINNMDKEECYRIIDELDKFMVENISYDMIPIYVARMADAILLTAINTHVDLEKVYPEGVNKIYHELLQVSEHGRIRRYLKSQFVDPIILERKKLLKENSYMIMNQIEKKIADSKGNISVTECADAIGVSATYIWKVLKMEGGKSFSEYQDEYKLDEAKRLLLETDMSVIEIATKLNYTNAQNFIRFFSKKTGITPGKFRKL